MHTRKFRYPLMLTAAVLSLPLVGGARPGHGEPTPLTGAVRGSVLVAPGAADVDADLSEVVVYLAGPGIDVAPEAIKPKTDPGVPVFTMNQEEKTYVPHVLPVPVGAVVEFANGDPFLHNVHTYSPKHKFNIAQLQGMRVKKQFTQPDVAHIKCDIHQNMSAYIVVVNSPFFAMATAEEGADGGRQYAFEIRDVPQGTYTLHAWHEKFEEHSTDVTVGGGEATTVDMQFQAAK